MIYSSSSKKLRKGAKKNGKCKGKDKGKDKGKGDWWFGNLKFIVGGLIPESNKDAFDDECEGDKHKAMRYIFEKLKTHFAGKKFNKDDAIFEGIKIFYFKLRGKNTLLFDYFFDQNRLRYSNRNILLAIEYVINGQLKYQRRDHKRPERIMNSKMKEFIANTSINILECHFCKRSIYENNYGQFISIDKVKKMGGACVTCQPKLLIPHKCPYERVRVENEWHRVECDWCEYRRDGYEQDFLQRACGATDDQMLFVIDTFNRARGFRKFKGKLTFEGIVENLNKMRPDKFNKKYGYFYGSSI